MATISHVQCTCPKCGRSFDGQCPTVVNAAENQELREKVLDGSIFLAECPVCGTSVLIRQPFLFMDPAAKLVLLMTDANVDDSGLDRSMTARKVSTPGELIEKLKIFDAGLDDVTMELCKYVTLQELGKDVDLKFLRMDGADNEIILTYPENGQMEMLAIGFNVYEDCRGIVSRNPALTEAATGLASVDSEWISRFIG